MAGISLAMSNTKGRDDFNTTSPTSFCPIPTSPVLTSIEPESMTRRILKTSMSRSRVASFSLYLPLALTGARPSQNTLAARKLATRGACAGSVMTSPRCTNSCWSSVNPTASFTSAQVATSAVSGQCSIDRMTARCFDGHT